ncbi:putative beta-glucosidase 23, partial [Bienertia sinuspersici]
ARQNGFMGFSLYLYHFIPVRNTTEDVMAAQRAYDFFIGLYMDPLTKGDYPEIVKKNAGNRIPEFTKNQSELVKRSFDFIGTLSQNRGITLVTWQQNGYHELPTLPWGLQGGLENGSNTKAYFVWSFLDLFELLFTYKKSFGIYYVNFSDPNLPRYPKLSQRWYSGFLRGEDVTIDDAGNRAEDDKLIIFGTTKNTDA